MGSLGLRRGRLGIPWRLRSPRRHAHFLHPLPLLGPDDHHHLRHKRVVLHGSAYPPVVARLNLGHRHAFAALAQGSLFIQLQRLRHAVRPQHGDLRSIHGLHFAKNEIFPQLAVYHRHSAAGPAHCGSTWAAGPCGDHQGSEALLDASFRTDENHIARFEIRELCILPVFAEFRFLGDFHRHRAAVRLSQFQCSVMDSRNLPKKRLAVPLPQAWTGACAPVRWRRAGWFLSQGRGSRKHEKKAQSQELVSAHFGVRPYLLLERRIRQSKSNGYGPKRRQKYPPFSFLPTCREVPTLRAIGSLYGFRFIPYFSRRITSPWPTSWSFSQRRYL